MHVFDFRDLIHVTLQPQYLRRRRSYVCNNLHRYLSGLEQHYYYPQASWKFEELFHLHSLAESLLVSEHLYSESISTNFPFHQEDTYSSSVRQQNSAPQAPPLPSAGDQAQQQLSPRQQEMHNLVDASPAPDNDVAQKDTPSECVRGISLLQDSHSPSIPLLPRKTNGQNDQTCNDSASSSEHQKWPGRLLQSPAPMDLSSSSSSHASKDGETSMSFSSSHSDYSPIPINREAGCDDPDPFEDHDIAIEFADLADQWESEGRHTKIDDQEKHEAQPQQFFLGVVRTALLEVNQKLPQVNTSCPLLALSAARAKYKTMVKGNNTSEMFKQMQLCASTLHLVPTGERYKLLCSIQDLPFEVNQFFLLTSRIVRKHRSLFLSSCKKHKELGTVYQAIGFEVYLLKKLLETQYSSIRPADFEFGDVICFMIAVMVAADNLLFEEESLDEGVIHVDCDFEQTTFEEYNMLPPNDKYSFQFVGFAFIQFFIGDAYDGVDTLEVASPWMSATTQQQQHAPLPRAGDQAQQQLPPPTQGQGAVSLAGTAAYWRSKNYS